MRRLALMTSLLAAGGPACGDSSGEPLDETGSTGVATSTGTTSTTAAQTDTTTASTGEATSADGSTGGFPPPVLDECIDDGSAGDHVYTCGELSYDVTIPEACLQMPCGLIFDVHGLTMSGEMQEANTHLRARGAERGYIVVQPNANPAPPAASWNPEVDDDAIIDFMQRVADSFHVDANRLHFTGFSQGGFMSWRMLCAHADILASVAPAAACGNDALIADCQLGPGEQPSEPVDVLYVHGTTDVLVPFDCAEPRRDAVVAAFELGDEEVVAESDGYRWTRHTGGDGTVLEFIVHDYDADNAIVLGGHCYLGSDDPGDAMGQLFSYACVDPGEVVWGEAVLDFFDAHPKG